MGSNSFEKQLFDNQKNTLQIDIMLLPYSIVTISIVTALLPHLSKLAIDKNLRLELGKNGFKHIHDSYSKEIVVSKYVNLLNSL